MTRNYSQFNPTIYWHDYETFGADTKRDRPAQFAGIRTDLDLNIVGEPLVIYAKPANDYLPNPEACLITGISPQTAKQKGLPETEFMQSILDEFSQPNTCVAGYNSIRFDDEITRNTLFRNLFDPYAREWQNGNSRWDIIDLVRVTYALRPGGIHWPLNADNKPSFRLEELSKANGIQHEHAHDALSDVIATIELAKLIKQKQPKLYDYVFNHRNKSKVSELLDLDNMRPVLHTSGMFPTEFACTALVVPLIPHPLNPNGVVVYDLRYDPQDLLQLNADQIRERLYTATDDLPEGQQRIALKTIHINKCPIVVPAKIDADTESRLQIDKTLAQKHLQQLRESHDLRSKLIEVFDHNPFEKEKDPDFSLYDGRFLSDEDKAVFRKIHRSDPYALANKSFDFLDSRFDTLYFRYRARNFPETLTDEETQDWNQFRLQRLNDESQYAGLNFKNYYALLEKLKAENAGKEENIKLLNELESYARSLEDLA